MVGVDVDPRVAEALAAGRSHVEDVPDEALRARSRSAARRRRATPTWPRSTRSSSRVPTPLTRNREPDLEPLIAAGTRAGGRAAAAASSWCSSRPPIPGTTREQLVPLLEESGLAAGRGLHAGLLARAGRPGPHRLHAAQHRRRSSAASPTSAAERAVALYSEVCDEIVPVSTPEAAELTKLLENVFRSVNIALVNELAMLCDRMGIDIWEVIDAAATKPYGFMRFEPGPGHGRPLPAGGPVLPGLAGARVRHARPSSSSSPARSTSACRTSAWSRSTRALNDHSKPVRGSRIADARRVLQAGRRRPARVAGAARSCGCCASRARSSSTTTTSCPELSRARTALAEWPEDAGLRGDRDRPSRARPTSAWSARRRSWSTSAASRAASRRRTSCGCDDSVGVVGLGYWGPNLARNFDRLPEAASCAWCCDAVRGGARALGRRLPAARATARARRPARRRRARRRGGRHAGAHPRGARRAGARGRASTASSRSRWRSRWPRPSRRSPRRRAPATAC